MVMEFKDSQQAFKEAISQGRLSGIIGGDLYAGDFMYMGTHEGIDLFKHIGTRKYLAHFGKPAPSQTTPLGSDRERRS